MITTKSFLNNRYFIYIIFMWVLGFLIVWPVGEFAINDDWAYAKNVFNIVVNKKFIIDDWPAMNLISQTIYGSVVTSIFGFSFTALRLSIFLLAIISSLYLYTICLQLSNQNTFLSFIITAALSFNAIFFSLSMTFMTDVFFLSMLVFIIYWLIHYISFKNTKSYIFFIVFCSIATLNRQQGLLFSLLIIAPVIYNEKGMTKKIIFSVLPLTICWLLSDKYRHYLTAYHIGHNIQQISDLVIYLKKAPFNNHFSNFGDELLVTGWCLFPVSSLIFFSLPKLNRRDWLGLTVTIIICTLITFPIYKLFPFGNIFNVYEIGPRMVKSTSAFLNNKTIVLLKLACFFISLVSISFAVFCIIKNLLKKPFITNNKLHLIFIFITVVYFIFVGFSKAYFDRYCLPIILLIALLIIPSSAKFNSTQKLFSLIILSIIYFTAVIETRDLFNWHKCRKMAIVHLTKNNINQNEIDGGFEYNGWIKTNSAYPTNPEKSWWWVNNDSYIVSGSRLKKTIADTCFTYQRVLPYYIDTVFILRQNKDK